MGIDGTISYPSKAAPQASDRLVEPEKRGVVAFIMSALHASRCRQASRVLRQYEHLLANELEQNSGDEHGRYEQDGANGIDEQVQAPK
ncbi:hypothetical protein [Bradyrhizobium cosmicum]|uniref:Uncharacterized protein n=1 Tax=Bradyrhizobium cosmicum TaxID=1404864 RepID=A0AAI8QEN7_9BRAD|nr:hypothetical protein [Bradyrhizobium cosmicum]BAL78701.1 hypothetical protein S23_55090 [Bradyrhizobium cosmicum]